MSGYVSINMFSFSRFRPFKTSLKQLTRYKNGPDHWSVLRKKNHPVDKALAHFDDFYQEIFGAQWPKLREGLLGKQKYVAVVNNYSDTDEILANLEVTGAINVRTLFRLEKEYLREQLESNQRVKRLESIWRSADDAPTNDNTQEVAPEEPKKLALKAALDEAQIDQNRLVEPRNALASEILHQFNPATKIKGKEDFIPDPTLTGRRENFVDPKFVVDIEKEFDFHFPEYLNVYCYEQDNFSDFPPARTGSTGVLGYYLMDGASLLPILALDIRPNDKVLDLCAAPGGKSLLALQTLYPRSLVCNDSSYGRTKRIFSVCRQFLYDLNERWLDTGRLKITCQDGRYFKTDDFDKILVDVPCTTDRHSLQKNENNIFNPARIKERLKLPELQSELLFSALQLVKIGGTVVYSTCSLSPIQNDGVVHTTLKRIWEETNLDFVIKDLSAALLQGDKIYKFADKSLMKYGSLVIPWPNRNYGPMYFCKIVRTK